MTGNPWGNVVSPAVPQGAAAFSSGVSGFRGNHHGGLIPGFRSNGGVAGNGHHRGIPAFTFIRSTWSIGGYGYGYAPEQPDQQAPDNGGGTAPAAPPVVINQYFGQAAADQEQPANTTSNFHYYQAPSNTDAAPGDSAYYLIAFKDHTIYSAVAYYTEGDTLHYFTAGNVHNQASLSLVDRQLTEQLNRDRNIDVRLP